MRDSIATAVRNRVVDKHAGDRDAATPLIIAAARAALEQRGERTKPLSETERRDWQAIYDDPRGGDPSRVTAVLGTIVDRYLQDIAGGFDLAAYRLVIAALPALLGPAFQGGDRPRGFEARYRVEGPVDDLRALAARSTLVFAPTHSSNLDSIVLGLALARAGLPPCVYPAGKHMFRNPVVGTLMDRLGAYRVDRELGAELYKEVLKTFCAELIRRGFHSVIFPGATRCRTHEIEPTIKLGLLGTIRDIDRPVAIVPVTINYQIVLEAESLIDYHLAGRGRERIVGDELFTARRVVNSIRRLWALDQAVVVRFGDPLESPQAAPVRELGAAITQAFVRETVWFATHVTARALFDLAAARAGSDDVHQLRAHPANQLRFDPRSVYASIAALIAVLRATPAAGSLDRDVNAAEPRAIVARAIAVWNAWHTRAPIIDTGAELAVGDVGLLYFYRNRTTQLALPGTGER